MGEKLNTCCFLSPWSGFSPCHRPERPVFTCQGHRYTSQADDNSSLLSGSAVWPWAQRGQPPGSLPQLCPLTAGGPLSKNWLSELRTAQPCCTDRKKTILIGCQTVSISELRKDCVVFWEEEQGREGRKRKQNSQKIHNSQEFLLSRRQTTQGTVFLDTGQLSEQESPAHTPQDVRTPSCTIPGLLRATSQAPRKATCHTWLEAKLGFTPTQLSSLSVFPSRCKTAIKINSRALSYTLSC